MIPVTIPIVIAVFTFLILLISAYAMLAGFDRVLQIARRNLPALSPAGMSSEVGTSMIPFAVQALPVMPRVEGYAVPQSLHYHQGHAWVASQGPTTAVVGIDEFTSKLVGTPDSITLPRLGDRCTQGEKGWSLSRGARSLEMLSPIDGEVIAVNERVMDNPDLVAADPYGSGWLLVVKSFNLKRNLRNLLSGSLARRWMEESAMELRSLFSPKLGMVYPDGGLPEEGLIESFEAAEWKRLTSRLYSIEPDHSVQ